MSSSCGEYVPTPPSTKTTSCAFPYNLNSTAAAAVQRCCGQSATITAYDNDCFRYCDVSGNQSAVASCLADVGGACFTNRDASGANPVSKPAMGLAVLMLTGLVAGMLG